MDIRLPRAEVMVLLNQRLTLGYPLAVVVVPNDGGPVLKFVADCYTRGGAIQIIVMYEIEDTKLALRNLHLAAALFFKSYGEMMADDCVWAYDDRKSPRDRQGVQLFRVTCTADVGTRNYLGTLPAPFFRELVSPMPSSFHDQLLHGLVSSTNDQLLLQWLNQDFVASS